MLRYICEVEYGVIVSNNNSKYRKCPNLSCCLPSVVLDAVQKWLKAGTKKASVSIQGREGAEDPVGRFAAEMGLCIKKTFLRKINVCVCIDRAKQQTPGVTGDNSANG